MEKLDSSGTENNYMGLNELINAIITFMTFYLNVTVFLIFATPWTIAPQPPLSLGFPRQEHWSGLPFPSPGDLPDPGTEPGSPTLQADALLTELPGKLMWLWRVL